MILVELRKDFLGENGYIFKRQKFEEANVLTDQVSTIIVAHRRKS
jgi:hypothetical protein